jgi:hypothetical protein
MNYLKRIEDNFSFKKNKIMVMLVAAVLIVALLVPAFYNSKNATNSNIDNNFGKLPK